MSAAHSASMPRPGICGAGQRRYARGMAQAFTGRRDFLKAAGAAALTSSIFTGNLKGANDKVNIGFIGVGQMGSGNIGYAAKVPGFQIAAVCDVYQPALERAHAQAKRLGFEGG